MWVFCVKFCMHNISNVSIAFIRQTMPTSMHNIPSCMHITCRNNQRTTSSYQNRPRYYVKSLTAQDACFGRYQASSAACTTLMFMHSIQSCTAQYIIMHGQHVLYQHMPTCLHNVPVYLQNVNMQYACACTTCIVQHSSVKPSMHSLKIKVHGVGPREFPSITGFWRRPWNCWDGKPVSTMYWEPLPNFHRGTGVHCIRYQGATHIGCSQGLCTEADLEMLHL